MKRKQGFALIELLAAVAVLVATFAIVSPNAASIDVSLQQATVDARAVSIYIKAQDKATIMRTSGQSEILENHEELGYTPNNYNGTTPLKYITSDDPDADLFYDEPFDGKWIIEYDPSTGTIFGVFTSNDGLDFYKGKQSDDNYRNASHDDLLEFAKENGYNISFYGNESPSIPNNKENVIEDDGPEPDKKPDPKNEPDGGQICTGFGYYEVYSDGTYGFYFLYNADTGEWRNVLNNGVLTKKDSLNGVEDSLSDTKTVVGDGYCIGLSKSGNKYLYVDTKANIGTIKEYSKDTIDSCDYENQWGYMWAFETSYVDKVNQPNVYSRLGFWVFDKKVSSMNSLSDPEQLYAMLKFAKSGVYVGKESIFGVSNPISTNHERGMGEWPEQEVYIRTARQLYDLSIYFSKNTSNDGYAASSEGVWFEQDRDIDYATYNWALYSNQTTSIPVQKPIGYNNMTDFKNAFMANYDGNGYSIKNIRLQSVKSGGKSYSGLFCCLKSYPYTKTSAAYKATNGKVTSGIVQNVNIYTTRLDDADYRGAVVAYVENGANVINCKANDGTTAVTGN